MSRQSRVLSLVAFALTSSVGVASVVLYADSRVTSPPVAGPQTAGLDPFAVLNSQSDLPPTDAGNKVFLAATSCGVERWSIKTGTDADVSQVNLQSSTPTTIASLDGLAKPASLPANNRIAPSETTVFQVAATLTKYKLESDSDYHMVLDDGSGHTLIAEIPAPACVGAASPMLTSIQRARAEFDAKYTPTGSFKTANVPVTVTGVGFFDALHGQTGVAPNGVELHAVLDLQFG